MITPFKNSIAIAILIAFTGLIPAASFADAENEDGEGDGVESSQLEYPDQNDVTKGWFWYHDEEKVKPKKAPKEKPATPEKQADKSAHPEKKPMTVAWMRKMLPKLEEAAIDNPTKENLEAYFYIKRALMDKAQKFSTLGSQTLMMNPLLDEVSRVPITGPGQFAMRDRQAKFKKEALRYLASNVGGLLVFSRGDCDMCRTQAPVTEYMRKDYDFAIRHISVGGKPLPWTNEWIPDGGGLSKTLGLTVFPTTVFAVPPNNYYIVSQGMMLQEDLIERIFAVAKQKKLLPQKMEMDIDPYSRGILTTEDLSDGASDDPQKISEYLQRKLQDRYKAFEP